MDLNKYRKYNQSYIEVIVSPPFIQPIKALRARQHIDQIIHSKEPRTGKLEVLDETEERGSRTPKKRRSHKTNNSEQNHSTSCASFNFEIFNIKNFTCSFGLRHEIHYPSSRNRDFRAAEGLGGGQIGEPVELVNVIKTEYMYKYNGQEWQDELGLNIYDFEARMYDPTTGRTTTQDPLADTFAHQSPYSFLNNNPMMFVDPTGMAAEHIYKLNEKTGDIDLVERNNDKHDTLVAENGDVIADNIHKDIFNEAESVNIQEDGLTVNNLTGESVKSLSSFVLRLSIYTQTEIAYGIYGFADQNGKLAGDTRFADVMPYSGNTDRTSTAAPTMDGTILTAQVHTHPSFEGGSTNMSGGDRLNLRVNKPMQSTILGRFGTATYKLNSKTNTIEKVSGKTFKSPYNKENIKNNLGWKKQF